MEAFSVTTEFRPPWKVITVEGALDFDTEGAFRSIVEAVVHQAPPRLLFDLTDVTFIDHRGVDVIRDAYYTLGSDDRVAVCGLGPHIQKVFILLGLVGRIPTYPTRYDAIVYGGLD
ncbi:STAS domain-containing protein [Microtetraspora malaysiensis]|uniref:STAS domain-containing protein n=1 Tax=Microtetraspora malaysiensis TaxID=161358 RepID=UPI003D8CE4C5